MALSLGDIKKRKGGSKSENTGGGPPKKKVILPWQDAQNLTEEIGNKTETSSTQDEGATSRLAALLNEPSTGERSQFAPMSESGANRKQIDNKSETRPSSEPTNTPVDSSSQIGNKSETNPDLGRTVCGSPIVDQGETAPPSPPRIERNPEIAPQRELSQSESETNRQQIEIKSVTNQEQESLNRKRKREQIDNKSETPASENWGFLRKSVTKSETETRTNRNQIGNNQETTTDLSCVVGLQRELLLFLYELSSRRRERSTGPLSLEAVTERIKTTKPSAKVSLRRLEMKGIIIRSGYKRGRAGWSSFEIRDSIYQELLLNQIGNKADTNREQTGNKSRAESDTQSVTSPSSSSSSIDPKKLTNTETEPKRELPAEWSNIDATPLGSLGFTRTHVVQVYESGKLTAQQLQDSIYAFDFDLRENAKTKAINGPPLNYFMGIVRRGNPYVPPKNYKSPEDAALERYLEMSKQRQEREGRAMDAAFLEWSGNLTAEAKTKLVPTSEFARIGSPSHAAQLKEHFREQVWPDLRQRILRGAL